MEKSEHNSQPARIGQQRRGDPGDLLVDLEHGEGLLLVEHLERELQLSRSSLAAQAATVQERRSRCSIATGAAFEPVATTSWRVVLMIRWNGGRAFYVRTSA